jgi:hypothetical protein
MNSRFNCPMRSHEARGDTLQTVTSIHAPMAVMLIPTT